MSGEKATLVVEIGAAAAVRLNRDGEAWGLPMIGIYEDAAQVSLIPAEEDTEGAVHNAEAGQQWPPSAELRATLSGWHRIKFQQGESGGAIATATFEGAKLRRPADAATNQETR